MQAMNLDEFRTVIKAQGVSTRIHAAFKCPMCETVQSIASLAKAGAAPDKVENLVGVSCVGRLTGANPPRKAPDGNPCNWTLGGLLRLHRLEVIDEEGKAHPFFEVATPEEAKSLEASLKGDIQ